MHDRQRVPPDNRLIANLDNTWRTPASVHRLMGRNADAYDIACALERLSLAGRIEVSAKATTVPKFLHPQSTLSIHFYRKRQA